MPKLIDLIGQRFGRLKVLEEASRINNQLAYKCQCDCGVIKPIAKGCLRSGRVNSCGCLQKELMKQRSMVHGMWGSPTYKSWVSMLQRCTNPNHQSYKDYGGRGITVCEKWLKFAGFFEDMDERPKGLTIERENNELGYFKENCCWADKTTQARNKRIRKTSTTGVTGVGWHKECKKYRARITVNKKELSLGFFKTIRAAASARKQAEILYW